jgi:hypothetical protein
MMLRKILTGLTLLSLSGCYIAAPPPAPVYAAPPPPPGYYAPAPAAYYGPAYAPGYYGAPVSVGIGFGGGRGGWRR